MNIVGHKKILEYFEKNIQAKKLANVYLFLGPSMVGKTAVVEWIGKQIAGDGFGFENPHPDIYELKLSEEKKELGIGAVKDLKVDLYQKPTYYPYRFFVLHNVDKMSVPGYNAMLKFLEEAPPYSIIFMLADSASGILDTIISRAQVINFFKVDEKDICDYIVSELGIDKKEADIISSLSLGLPGKAIRMAKDREYMESELEKIKESIVFFKMLPQDKLNFIDKITSSKGKDYTSTVKDMYSKVYVWKTVLHDGLLLKLGMSDKIKYKMFQKDICEIWKDKGYDTIVGYIRGLDDLRADLDKNLNIQLSFYNFILNNSI